MAVASPVRIHQDAHADPRLVAVGSSAVGLLVCCALWSAANEPRGHVPAGIAYWYGDEADIEALLH